MSSMEVRFLITLIFSVNPITACPPEVIDFRDAIGTPSLFSSFGSLSLSAASTVVGVCSSSSWCSSISMENLNVYLPRLLASVSWRL